MASVPASISQCAATHPTTYNQAKKTESANNKAQGKKWVGVIEYAIAFRNGT